MDQASNVRETAAFARRVVCRTLTVVGGMAAGTAVAWCLSTATASAETPIDSFGDRNPVLAEVVQPVGDTLDEVAERLSDPPPPPRNPIGDVGDKIKKAADRFGDRTAEHVDVLPPCADEVCGLAGIDGIADTSDLSAGLGRLDTEITPPAAPPTPAVGTVAGPGVDPERTAERTATDRAYADGMSRRGSPDSGPVPSLPDLPTWPAPFPPSAPAPGHTGQTGGSPADSSLFAALPWLDRSPGLVRGLTVPATEATTVGRVGAQPGVAPD